MVEGFRVLGFGQVVVNLCLVQDSKYQIRPFKRPSKSCHAATVDTEKTCITLGTLYLGIIVW